MTFGEEKQVCQRLVASAEGPFTTVCIIGTLRLSTTVGHDSKCHATFHSFEMSPSELWDGVFSRGFSSWRRRLSTVRIYFNEMSVFSLSFPMLSRIIFAHS